MSFSRIIAMLAALAVGASVTAAALQQLSPKTAVVLLAISAGVLAFTERVQGGRSKPRGGSSGRGRGLTLAFTVFAVLALPILQVACNTTDLQRSKNFGNRTVAAVSQVPHVIQALKDAGKITTADADFYFGLSDETTDSLSATNNQLQAMTPASTNKDAVLLALNGTQDLISRLLTRIAGRTDSARDRVRTILVLVRGFLFAATAYLGNSVFAKVRAAPLTKESKLAQLERLCDPKKLQPELADLQV